MCLFFASCNTGGNSPSVFSIVSYNVQNLMDASLDGTEYDEYKPSGGWTENAYNTRMKRLSEVLHAQEIRDADVLILQEVEHEGVMEDLMRMYLSRRGWKYYAVVKDPDSPIGIGMASREKPESVLAHQGAGGRPVLEAVFSTPQGKLVLYGVHGKSQKGENTEKLRIEMVRTVTAAAGEHPNALILVCGDFNEDPDCSLSACEQTALVLLDLPVTALYSQRGSLPVTGEKHLVSASVWYDPWLDKAVCSERGSYVFQSVWHQYDQFLGRSDLFDKKGWDFQDFSVIAQPVCLKPDGTPFAWDRTLLSGYSDHLPVRLRLVSF